MKKKKIIVISLILSIILIGTTKLKASEIEVRNAKYNIYTSLSRDENVCGKPQSYGYKNLDDNTDTRERPYVNKIQYLFDANLSANQSYTITFTQSYNPKTDVVARPDAFIYRMEASTTTSDSGLSASNISSFKCFLTNDKNNNYRVNVTCNVVPLNNIKKIWIEQKHPNCMTYVNYFNTYFLKINQNTGTEEAINNQTIIIQQGQDKINDSINQDHEYNKDASVNTEEEKNKFNNFEQQEDSLRNGINLDIEDSQITIDPNANNFIWETINKLRSMSPKIVLLFTSVLSLGLMKMILGR